MDYLYNSGNKNLVPKYENMFGNYQSALKIIDDVVLKNYITNLSKMRIVPLKDEDIKNNIQDNVRIFKITEVVYEENETASHKFASVFNTLSTAKSSLFIIIDSDGTKTDFYMGIRSFDDEKTAVSIFKTIKNSLVGQFPGIKTEDCKYEKIVEILKKINTNSVAAVSSVANPKDDDNVSNRGYVQGLEKLVLSMQGHKYTGIILANTTEQKQVSALRKEYEKVYTQLSPLANSQVNYSASSSTSLTEGKTTGSSHTLSANTSNSTGESSSRSTSTSESVSSENASGKMLKSLAAASAAAGLALSPFTGGISLAAGGILSAGLNAAGSAVSETKSHSTSYGDSVSSSRNYTEGTGESNSVSSSRSSSKGETSGSSNALTVTLQDKSVINTLNRIDRQLERLNDFESVGMYECSAYFLSDNLSTSEIAASTYKALISGENSGVETSAINSWGGSRDSEIKKANLIGKYVKNFIHPVFRYKSEFGNIENVTPCSFVSGNELAIHMGLPRHSVCGLPVIEHADFGKEVVKYDKEKSGPGIRLGKIFNMGSVCENNVILDKNSLTMHTFVTGSTGSGKSNTVYEMVRQLYNQGIKFMVIEPAKGEYKNIFGGKKDVSVYGTNPYYTGLLRVNPFKFPKGIHVLEHIDRLIEIFNVCWPMYAAMPAVLKDSVERAYTEAGWDLSLSINKYNEGLFPTFSDVLNEMNEVVRESSFSQEVKDNYTGSLSTRIKSLTNGIYGRIFESSGIDDSKLFDNNVIIDLSRVGSVETKSMIMGILVMKLQEYRMSVGGMNSDLKHITVLEEAHNLLKRTSQEQSSESSNLLGKSVEMLSNAIAEIRTFGEGFIIADQSPGMLDLSVIRNTNTKIIMRLPEESDRNLAGKAAGLNDSQINEISKLPVGVAAVYQNNWVEPVLCKINHRDDSANSPYKYSGHNIRPDKTDDIKVLKCLLDKLAGERLDYNLEEINKVIIRSSMSTKTKTKTIKALGRNGRPGIEDIEDAVYEILSSAEVRKWADESESIEEWRAVYIENNFEVFNCFKTQKQNILMECILRAEARKYNKLEEYLEQWDKFLKGEVK